MSTSRSLSKIDQEVESQYMVNPEFWDDFKIKLETVLDEKNEQRADICIRLYLFPGMPGGYTPQELSCLLCELELIALQFRVCIYLHHTNENLPLEYKELLEKFSAQNLLVNKSAIRKENLWRTIQANIVRYYIDRSVSSTSTTLSAALSITHATRDIIADVLYISSLDSHSMVPALNHESNLPVHNLILLDKCISSEAQSILTGDVLFGVQKPNILSKFSIMPSDNLQAMASLNPDPAYRLTVNKIYAQNPALATAFVNAFLEHLVDMRLREAAGRASQSTLEDVKKGEEPRTPTKSARATPQGTPTILNAGSTGNDDDSDEHDETITLAPSDIEQNVVLRNNSTLLANAHTVSLFGNTSSRVSRNSTVHNATFKNTSYSAAAK